MSKTYTTVQGDMWDSIAHRELGGSRYTGQLMSANQQYRDYYLFPAGITLSLPEIHEPANDTFPPWKKVTE